MVRQFTRRGIALILCLAATSWSGVLFAAEDGNPSRPSASTHTSQDPPIVPLVPLVLLPSAQPVTPSRFVLRELPTSVPFEQRWWGREQWHRNNGARTAVILGSVAAITGAALLVYANRPACRSNPSAAACGFGTKVIGGAVLAGGAVAITVGALSWR